MRIDELELDWIKFTASKTITGASNTSDHTLSDKLISESLESIESDLDRPCGSGKSIAKMRSYEILLILRLSTIS